MQTIFKNMLSCFRHTLFVPFISIVVISIILFFLFYQPVELENDSQIIQTKNKVETKHSDKYLWKTAYDIQFDGQNIDVKVFIKLVRGENVRPLQVENVIKSWSQQIKSVWSSQYAIQTNNGDQYPINVSAEFVRIKPHHEVIIRRASKKIDEYNWGITTRPNIIAHEFGHMIGAFDEYPGGAINPHTKLIDPTSIMGSAKHSSKTYPRHYQDVQEWFATHVEPNINIVYIGPKSKDS